MPFAGLSQLNATLLSGLAVLSVFLWPHATHLGGISCDKAPYTVRILSFDPFMMHIEDFLTPKEVSYLLEVGKPLYKRSQVNPETILSDGRTSSTATLPLDDPVAQCIQSRAAEIQGFVPLESIERLQVTRYLQGQQYRAHYDWSLVGKGTNERLSTFFAILQANCTGCGTEFPELLSNWSGRDSRWCSFVECGNLEMETLTVKPKVGSALYWRNLLEN